MSRFRDRTWSLPAIESHRCWRQLLDRRSTAGDLEINLYNLGAAQHSHSGNLRTTTMTTGTATPATPRGPSLVFHPAEDMASGKWCGSRIPAACAREIGTRVVNLGFPLHSGRLRQHCEASLAPHQLLGHAAGLAWGCCCACDSVVTSLLELLQHEINGPRPAFWRSSKTLEDKRRPTTLGAENGVPCIIERQHVGASCLMTLLNDISKITAILYR
jgi:hypothetical protein